MSKLMRSVLTRIAILFVGLLACRPVIAVGWEELLFLAVLVVFLLWPLLQKNYRTLDAFNRWRNDPKNSKSNKPR